MTSPASDETETRARPPGRGRGVVAVFALVAVVSLVETWRAVTASSRVATILEWQAAGQKVRGDFRAGDLVVFAPAWADQVGRSFLGDIIPVEMAARVGADHYERIWEVSIRDARAPETLVKGARLVEEQRFGHVRVALWDKGPAVRTLYAFTAHLPDARVVEVDARGAERPCYHDGAGFRCGSTRIEKRVTEVDYQPRLATMIPVSGADTTALDYDAVPMGKSLVVYTGLHDYYARKNGSGPINVTVEIDGEKLVVPPATNESGWQRTALDTARFDGAPHKVRFLVSAPLPPWRNLAIDAETRASPAALVPK